MIRRAVRTVSYRLDLLRSECRKFSARLKFGRNIRFGPRVWFGPGVDIEIFDNGTIHIDADTWLGRGVLISAKGGHISIGRNSLINRGCVIVATSEISIGENALIAEHVTIRDQDHTHDDNGIPFAEQGRIDGAITIGRNVWLGAKVTVTRGVSIAQSSVVGANAVVTRSIASSGIYVGIPAKLIDGPGTSRA